MDWNSSQEINKKAMAIIRVSSRQQEGNTSLDAQEFEIQKYCREFGLELTVSNHVKLRFSLPIPFGSQSMVA